MKTRTTTQEANENYTYADGLKNGLNLWLALVIMVDTPLKHFDYIAPQFFWCMAMGVASTVYVKCSHASFFQPKNDAEVPETQSEYMNPKMA